MKGLVSNNKGEKKIVPVPPNQETVNTLFGTDIRTEEDMENWLKSRRPNLKGQQPKNGEEMSLSRVGTDLYEKVNDNVFFIKQDLTCNTISTNTR